MLSARQIDRPIRPLFPEGFKNDVQIITTVLSIDSELDADVLAVCAAGAALAVSDIPFEKTVAAVRVGRDEGKYICNPTMPQYETGGMDIVVAGTLDGVMMVEGGGNEISEEDFLGAVEFAHVEIKKICKAIDKLAKKCGKAKKDFPIPTKDEALYAWVEKNFKKDVSKAMRVTEKLERNAAFAKLTRAKRSRASKKDDAIARKARRSQEQRLREDHQDHGRGRASRDGRGRSHSSRRPQARRNPSDLVESPLRTARARFGRLPARADAGLHGRDARLDLATNSASTASWRFRTSATCTTTIFRRTRRAKRVPMRAPAGAKSATAHLAERALVPILPPVDEFPYTLRLISEVLESNGSSSMASVCGSTLALMDAGVPIKKHVAGVAMGLVLHGKKHAILTDIQGLEDALGEMDFKVAGTVDGITAIQMDIKVQGITIDIMREALAAGQEIAPLAHHRQAQGDARPKHRTELSPFAPAYARASDQSRQDQRRHRTRW